MNPPCDRVCLWLMPAPAAAADKTHQQLLAEIRMLQEQQAQLQQMLGGLADTLKTMRHEDRRADRRHAQGFRRPDAGDRRHRRRRTGAAREVGRHQRPSRDDDAGDRVDAPGDPVRAGSAAPAGLPGDPSGCTRRQVRQPRHADAALGAGVSPSKAYDAAFNDYTSGQYDLAIQGFEFYIENSPPRHVRTMRSWGSEIRTTRSGTTRKR